MTYRVEISKPAIEDALAAYAFIAKDSPTLAERWYLGLMDAIDALEKYPRRCRRATEADEFTVELRQLRYKSHRILFTIEGHSVRVQHVRHAARRRLRPEEL